MRCWGRCRSSGFSGESDSSMKSMEDRHSHSPADSGQRNSSRLPTDARPSLHDRHRGSSQSEDQHPAARSQSAMTGTQPALSSPQMPISPLIQRLVGHPSREHELSGWPTTADELTSQFATVATPRFSAQLPMRSIQRLASNVSLACSQGLGL